MLAGRFIVFGIIVLAVYQTHIFPWLTMTPASPKSLAISVIFGAVIMMIMLPRGKD